ncbi:hypothetical protein DFH01_09735 [Falsiroseomonas bella]|uniref:Uncharacterized protein n=2 Tax=Falsiroseomonas bella TaxID=2184016 RepID=A0A317FHM3_9PROT|nr:hypothetical protein DFH01_09735 [Falsiroseomonas bella]
MISGIYDAICRDGGAAVRRADTLVGASGPHQVFYMPFGHVERSARLVIVGITPGTTQLEMAYKKVHELHRQGMPRDKVFRAVKAHAAFGGPMRQNLLRMLRHFGFAALLGVHDEADLWDSASQLVHSTSVVPHAAFKNDKMFNGSFQEVLASPALRGSFERDFVGELALLPADAVFVALGPTPLDALDHCVERGLLPRERVLGALAHPSAGAGSQVDVYIGERDPETLKPRDPVRGRVARLLGNAARMRAAVAALGGRGAAVPEVRSSTPSATSPAPTREQPPAPGRVAPAAHAATAPGGPGPNGRLHATVSRGPKAGTVLRPHVHADGCHVVSPTRFEADYIRLSVDQPLDDYLRRGLKLRMSAPGVAPSLISPDSIRGRGA